MLHWYVIVSSIALLCVFVFLAFASYSVSSDEKLGWCIVFGLLSTACLVLGIYGIDIVVRGVA